jgi:hypothetical protein
MARARKSHMSGEENVRSSKTELEQAYAGAGGNKYVVYCEHAKDEVGNRRILISNFAARYAAAFFIKRVIGKDDWAECEAPADGQSLMTSANIRITMYDGNLWKLVEYDPTELEAAWSDQEVINSVGRFKYGRVETRHEDVHSENDNAVGTDSAVRERGDKSKSRREPRGDRPKREPKSRPDTTGHLSANDIAKELKVEPREVRGVLRSLKLIKPDHGWSWPAAQARKIQAQVADKLRQDMAERSKKVKSK